MRVLGDRNSQYLGFLPAVVFDQMAVDRRILAATIGGRVVGYAAFYPHRRLIKLVHLCVSAEHRGLGVAKSLIGRLSADHAESDGLTAHCRVDFPADDVWPRLGFLPVGERPGRSKRGSTLRIWIRRHDHPTLFSVEAPDCARVILDACVAFDLQDPDSEKAQESIALQADWLSDDFKLCVTEELSIEIKRNPDPLERRRRWQFASGFACVHHDREQLAIVRTDLDDLFPEPRSTSDESDLNQVAMAISAEVQFLVTRDDALLDKGAEITRRWGLVILRPSELIGQSYEQKREGLYRPARLAGTPVTEARAKVSDLASLSQAFLSHGTGEKKRTFNAILRRAEAAPEDCDVRIFRDGSGELAGLLVLDNTEVGVSSISLLRVKRVRAADLVARHLLWQAVIRAGASGKRVLVLRDAHHPDSLRSAFEPLGFHQEGEDWAKASMPGLWTGSDLATALRATSQRARHEPFLSRIASVAQEAPEHLTMGRQVDLELAVWPGKLKGSQVPTFLVPIRAHWASQLFEERIADYDLFGAPPGLILSTENVYYRSAQGPGVRAPGRVLWYVSAAPGVPHSKQVAGCSYIREVVVGTATEVFGTFERLGVYEWQDVLKVAQGSPHGEVMAFRFSHSELFPHPIPYSTLKSEIEACAGSVPTVRGPSAISPRCFERLYLRGTGLG